ncbi:hypothetical protein bcgnr5372_27630 [Bacillus luti]|nr:hypothetical protein [Bacillus cereus]HDR8331234.1 hypothetical protein [Bacillus cereus]HDR8338283.1 hypothetical protein [Bacillus cereus]
MLITKTVMLCWMPSNKDHFLKKGYEFTKFKDKFEAKVEDLSPKSNVEVVFTCDYCQIELKNKYHMYLRSINNFPPINKVCCANCRYIKNKEILTYKSENGILDVFDPGYFISEKNRVSFIKNHIVKYGDLKNLTNSSSGWKIIRFLNKYKDNLAEIVEELGYKYYDMVSIKYDYYENFSILERNINELIEKIGRFPSYDEITKELKCVDRFIAMHGGMTGIINKMNYDTDKELIDDSGYFNRSSYEFIVAQFLIKHNIPFKRDQSPFPDSTKNFKSDFAIYPKSGKEIHVELWGFGTEEYQETRKEKEEHYKKYSSAIHLVSLEKKMFRKKYDEIQNELIKMLGPLLKMDLFKVNNEYIIPKVLSDKQIINELMHYSEDGEILPKYEYLRKVGKTSLFDEAVKRHGSFMAFAKKYNLKTQGKSKGFWNEEEVFNQLIKVVKIHGSVKHFMRTHGKCDTANDFKGLFYYIRKIGSRDIVLSFFEFCLKNSLSINDEDVEYLKTTSKLKKEEHEKFAIKAKRILNELNLQQ